VIDKKCKGKVAEPDRSLKEKLGVMAVEVVVQLLADLKNGAADMKSP
jgi:hypothetical protein